MSAQKSQDGGLAFPMESRDIPGMTLRDYFAANVTFEHPDITEAAIVLGEDEATAETMVVDQVIRAMARIRYRLADAMLAERAKGGSR